MPAHVRGRLEQQRRVQIGAERNHHVVPRTRDGAEADESHTAGDDQQHAGEEYQAGLLPPSHEQQRTPASGADAAHHNLASVQSVIQLHPNARARVFSFLRDSAQRLKEDLQEQLRVDLGLPADGALGGIALPTITDIYGPSLTAEQLGGLSPLAQRLRDHVLQFNAQQRLAYDYARAFLEDDVRNPQRPLGVREPLRMIVSGEGGTGKTFFIQAVAMLTQLTYRDHAPGEGCGHYAPIALLAPTGCAAFLIGGHTLHSALHLPMKQRDMRKLPAETSRNTVKLQAEWRGARVLVIDEVSMVGRATLHGVSLRLSRALRCSEPFGGLHVIMCGDFYQLAAVKAMPLMGTRTDSNVARARMTADDATADLAALELYQQFHAFFEFTEQKRTSHAAFIAALRLLRRGVVRNANPAAWVPTYDELMRQPDLTSGFLDHWLPRNVMDAIALVNTRAVPETQEAEVLTDDVTILATKWAYVNVYNREHMEAKATEHGRVTCWAQHHIAGTRAQQRSEGSHAVVRMPRGGARLRGVGRNGVMAAAAAASAAAAAAAAATTTARQPAGGAGSETDGSNDDDDGNNDLAGRVALLADDRTAAEHAARIGNTPAAVRRFLLRYEPSGSDSERKPLAPKLELAKGCRVMLMRNSATALGVVNGALGTVVSFVYFGVNPSGRPPDSVVCATFDAAVASPPPLPVVLVQLDSFRGASFLPGVERVVPICMVECGVRYGASSYRRWQLPLMLSKATTVHKSQGQSLTAVAFDTRGVFQRGLAYVAVSRARHFERLYLLKARLDVGSFNHDATAVEREYRRLRALRPPPAPALHGDDDDSSVLPGSGGAIATAVAAVRTAVTPTAIAATAATMPPVQVLSPTPTPLQPRIAARRPQPQPRPSAHARRVAGGVATAGPSVEAVAPARRQAAVRRDQVCACAWCVCMCVCVPLNACL